MTEKKKTIRLKDDELEKVSGGYTGIDDPDFEYPKVGIYTIERTTIFIYSRIFRMSDGKAFVCNGCQNNNDKTTTWTFENVDGEFESLLVVADKDPYIMTEFSNTP